MKWPSIIAVLLSLLVLHYQDAEAAKGKGFREAAESLQRLFGDQRPSESPNKRDGGKNDASPSNLQENSGSDPVAVSKTGIKQQACEMHESNQSISKAKDEPNNLGNCSESISSNQQPVTDSSNVHSTISSSASPVLETGVTANSSESFPEDFLYGIGLSIIPAIFVYFGQGYLVRARTSMGKITMPALVVSLLFLAAGAFLCAIAGRFGALIVLLLSLSWFANGVTQFVRTKRHI